MPATRIFDAEQVGYMLSHVRNLPRLMGDEETNTAFPNARQWRLDHLAAYEAARSWLDQAGDLIDTTHIKPAEVARLIAGTYRLV